MVVAVSALPSVLTCSVFGGFSLRQEDVSVSSGVGLPLSDRGYEIFNFRQNQETVRGEAIIHQYRVLVSVFCWCTERRGGVFAAFVCRWVMGG